MLSIGQVSEDYFIDWVYDPATNTYKRKNGGEAHLDRNTDKQLEAKNIVIIFTGESNANDGYENNAHLLYETTGSGDAVIFMDGKEIKGKWSKDSRTDKTIITNNKWKRNRI